jgi:hypothetical protein
MADTTFSQCTAPHEVAEITDHHCDCHAALDNPKKRQAGSRPGVFSS